MIVEMVPKTVKSGDNCGREGDSRWSGGMGEGDALSHALPKAVNTFQSLANCDQKVSRRFARFMSFGVQQCCLLSPDLRSESNVLDFFRAPLSLLFFIVFESFNVSSGIKMRHVIVIVNMPHACLSWNISGDIKSRTPSLASGTCVNK